MSTRLYHYHYDLWPQIVVDTVGPGDTSSCSEESRLCPVKVLLCMFAAQPVFEYRRKTQRTCCCVSSECPAGGAISLLAPVSVLLIGENDVTAALSQTGCSLTWWIHRHFDWYQESCLLQWHNHYYNFSYSWIVI